MGKGFKNCTLPKNNSEENKIFFSFRKLFYKFINKISDTKLNLNTSGTGLFDKEVINRLKKINDPLPLFKRTSF